MIIKNDTAGIQLIFEGQLLVRYQLLFFSKQSRKCLSAVPFKSVVGGGGEERKIFLGGEGSNFELFYPT